PPRLEFRRPGRLDGSPPARGIVGRLALNALPRSRLRGSGNILLPLPGRPGIPQRHRPVEDESIFTGIDRVPPEVSEALELISRIRGIGSDARLDPRSPLDDERFRIQVLPEVSFLRI